MNNLIKLIPKQTINSMSNVRPFRVFEPVLAKLSKLRCCNPSDVRAAVTSVSVENLKASILKFRTLNESPFTAPNSSALKSAIRYSVKDLFPNGLPKLIPETNVNKLMSQTNWQANTGFDDFKKKKFIKHKFLNLFSSFGRGYDLVKLERFTKWPALMFSKLSVKRPNSIGIRAVYAVPGLLAACESRFTIPVTGHFLSCRKSSYCVGYRQIELSQKMKSLYGKHNLCLDFSSFDLLLVPAFIRAAFSIVKSRFDPSVARYLDVLENYFISGSNYHPFIGIVARKRGVPSGSSFTNIIDSFANLIIIRYVLIMTGQNCFIENILVHGDDCVITSRVRLNVTKISNCISKLGMVVNKEKSVQYTNKQNLVDFLGSTWNNGLPERDLSTACSKACLVSGKPIILPKVDDYIKSRIYSILGFDHRLPSIWKELGFGTLKGTRLFLLNEGLAWDQAQDNVARGVDGHWVVAPEHPWMLR